MNDNLSRLISVAMGARPQYDKAVGVKANRSAGVRVRKMMQEVRAIALEIRKEANPVVIRQRKKKSSELLATLN